MSASRVASGAPGIPPTWTSSAKDLVTTALGSSRLWATLGYGIVNEIYWPATSDPQLRDLGFILARDGVWIELKRAQSYTVTRPQPFIPLPRVTHSGPDYRFTFEVVPDPCRDVLLISYALEGDYQVYVLLAPHLGGEGVHNTAWVDGDLFARNGAHALALVARPPCSRASVGFVGESDGWQDFNRHGRMTDTFDLADDGNVAIIGELGARAGVLALGFNQTPEGARTLAAASLAQGFWAARDDFESGWRTWAAAIDLPSASPALTPELIDEAYLSATMLKVHEDRTFPGAVVASLSVPWGNSSDSRGGYHLVWTRDAVETAFALLAIGLRADAERMAEYLAATQLADGHWHQNFFPDGRPFWHGIQLDETAFPILLAAALYPGAASAPPDIIAMVRRAAAFVAQVGPMSPQDRWEENSGANPFTLAAEVAALVASASFLDATDRDYVWSIADCWNERIEEWCYVDHTDLTERFSVPGYYVRIAAPTPPGRPARIELRNRAGETIDAVDLVGLEFLSLVRLGLRRADDPRILASLRVVDALLRVDTPAGPLYHRYNDDGYGEHEDGRPFDGTGIGRAWPLLTGERGHFALDAGDDPLPYLETMLRTAGGCGLLPEQAWDAAPLPDRFLLPGRPTGSAMPLCWAHAEFLKLFIARHRGRPCERLQVVEDRYRDPRVASMWHWRADSPFATLPPGRHLIIEDSRPFTLRVGFDGWNDTTEIVAASMGLGLHGVRLDAVALASVREVNFTRRHGDTWEGTDYLIGVAPDPPPFQSR
jgi:glucoamylase